MTPKQKAIEVLEEMEEHMILHQSIHKDDVRHCAMVVIRNAMEVAQDDIHFKHTDYTIGHLKYKSYWREVEKELQLLNQ